jgi:CubicO group peptidase (beta-lactamase class C family)
MSTTRRLAAVAAVLAMGALAGCTSTADGAPAASMLPLVTTTQVPAVTTPPTDAAPMTSTPVAPSTSVTGPTSTTTSTASTSTTSTTVPRPVTYDALRFAADGLAVDNLAVSVSVWRDGQPAFEYADGVRGDGQPLDTDSPFVIASVSKMVTALSITRLVEDDRVELTDEVPWDALGIAHDPAWDSTTVRQLLAHTSGMPVARKSWLDDPGSCDIPLREAMALPPTDTLGTWTYSNGNYCALGLLVEHVTGLALDEAAYQLVFDPAGITGPYLSTDGFRESSVPYVKGLARLQRLGGAGTWLASTDDIAAMFSAVTDDDLVTLQWPGIIIDQYGWGHTGSLDGAEACAWVMQDGRTVIIAFISGSKPNTGGEVCDKVVPALASDLGVYAGDPVRNPV